MTDFILSAPPGDGISSMCFSPVDNTANLLVSSWDSTVRLYSPQSGSSGYAGGLEARYTHYFDGAVLSCCYSGDGYQAFCGGLDKTVHMLDIHRNAKEPIMAHHTAVSSIAYNIDNSLLLSGSWDGALHAYDCKGGKLIHNTSMPNNGKVYSISTSKDKIIVATSSKQIAIYDIRNLSFPEQLRESPLKHQIRTVRCSPDGTSFAVGSVEGRIALEYFDMSSEVQSAKYAFKCHRREDLAYPVNCIEYHPKFGTFASGGCDGTVNIWDGGNKKRLCSLGPYPTSIAAMSFSADASMLAIAASYTFEEGEKQNVPEDNIYIHFVNDTEVRPRLKA